MEVAAVRAAPVEHEERHQVTGGRADQGRMASAGATRASALVSCRPPPTLISEGQRALRGFEAGEGEAAQQGAHDGAGKIDGQQRDLRAEQGRMRNRRVAFGHAALVGDQPGGQQHGEIGGGGGEPALAEPVIQAGGDFHGGRDGEEHEGEGQGIVRGEEQRRAGAESGERGEGGDDQQVLAPGDGEAEDGEGEQQRSGGPGGDGVEAGGGFEEEGREDQDGGQAVERGFQAACRRSARRPDQPEHGVEQADRRRPALGEKVPDSVSARSR